jgi:hypothetical protein
MEASYFDNLSVTGTSSMRELTANVIVLIKISELKVPK